MPKLIVLSAPSGAGKTTLCLKLLRDFPQLELSISTTTRAPRGLEKGGVDYHFVTQDHFKAQIAANRFAEWALVHGNYYGTSKDVIESAFGAGKSILLDIDVQGAASLKKAYPQECVSFFISPPSLVVLEQRLRSRGTDSEESIQKRLNNSREEMARAADFDHTIVNDELDRAYSELCSRIDSALGAFHG